MGKIAKSWLEGLGQLSRHAQSKKRTKFVSKTSQKGIRNCGTRFTRRRKKYWGKVIADLEPAEWGTRQQSVFGTEPSRNVSNNLNEPGVKAKHIWGGRNDAGKRRRWGGVSFGKPRVN